MMKKIYLILALATCLSSCNKWLDLEPALEIREDGMFGTEQGFMDVLTGAYMRMSTPSLYGCYTTVMLPELLANNWIITSGTIAYDISQFNYQQTVVKSVLEVVWLQYYQTIININALLSVIDEKQSLFTDNHYNLIKGEALGLRAYLHFDLLRYFGPQPTNTDMGRTAIPYVTIVTKNPNELKSLPYNEVLEKIITDLNKSEELLKEDPITEYTNSELNSPGTLAGANIVIPDFQYYRQIKFNYYAVKATKARYYSWIGNKAQAAEYAIEVINAKNADGSSKFELGDEQYAATYKNLSFPTEHIFAVHNSNATNTLKSYFFDYQTMYTNTKANYESAFETSLNTFDIRSTSSRLWEEKYVPLVSTPYYYFKKFAETESTAYKQMPLIRLSEMYFIAIEAGHLDLFRTFRIERNMDSSLDGTLDSDTAIMERLEKEYRKEFYGEGQMFFFYKRLGYTSYSWPVIREINPDSYIIPIPDTQSVFE